MKKRKLKGFVLPSIYIATIIVLAISITLFSRNLMASKEPTVDNYDYSVNVFNESDDSSEVVNEEIETPVMKASKPFIGDDISVLKDYYDVDGTSESQENALIYYQNTYMPNTGILYASDNVFEVIASIDGKVKEIKQDEILGTVLTLESDKVTCVYYTLGEVLVKEDDEVKQNDIIAKSGQSEIDTTKQTLLFEVYLDGILTNPNTFYEKTVNELD